MSALKLEEGYTVYENPALKAELESICAKFWSDASFQVKVESDCFKMVVLMKPLIGKPNRRLSYFQMKSKDIDYEAFLRNAALRFKEMAEQAREHHNFYETVKHLNLDEGQLNAKYKAHKLAKRGIATLPYQDKIWEYEFNEPDVKVKRPFSMKLKYFECGDEDVSSHVKTAKCWKLFYQYSPYGHGHFEIELWDYDAIPSKPTDSEAMSLSKKISKLIVDTQLRYTKQEYAQDNIMKRIENAAVPYKFS